MSPLLKAARKIYSGIKRDFYYTLDNRQIGKTGLNEIETLALALFTLDVIIGVGKIVVLLY